MLAAIFAPILTEPALAQEHDHLGMDMTMPGRITIRRRLYGDGRRSAMLAFSNKDRVPGRSLAAWLAEANWDIDEHNTLFARVILGD
jgi:hypothetical protein